MVAAIMKKFKPYSSTRTSTSMMYEVILYSYSTKRTSFFHTAVQQYSVLVIVSLYFVPTQGRLESIRPSLDEDQK